MFFSKKTKRQPRRKSKPAPAKQTRITEVQWKEAEKQAFRELDGRASDFARYYMEGNRE